MAVTNAVKRSEQLHILVDSNVKERVRSEAARIGVSMSAYVNVCIAYYQDAMSVENDKDRR